MGKQNPRQARYELEQAASNRRAEEKRLAEEAQGLYRTEGQIDSVGKSGRATLITLTNGHSGATMLNSIVDGWKEGDYVELVLRKSDYSHDTIQTDSYNITKDKLF